MAGEGYSAGSAYVSVLPSFEGFQDKVKAEFATSGDDAGKAFGTAFQDRLKVAFADLPNAKITADADTAAAKAKLDAVAKTRTATVKVSIDQEGLKSLALPAAGLGLASALGPSAVGGALGLAGIGVGFAAAAAGALSFGAVAKGMFSDVTSAQKALTTAQAAYAKADTTAQRTAALQAEKAALDGLTPSEQQLATELSALTTAWGQLQAAEQPVVGAAIAPWLSTATSGMRLLKPLVTDSANAIELLGNEADVALQSPFWDKFASTFGQTGEEAIQVFGTAAGQVGDGLAHLFTTFAPDIDNLLPLVDKLSGAFDTWSKSVTSGGLEDFFKTTFSPANVATLKQDGQDLATALGNIAKATAQLSPTAFAGLSNVLDILAKLTPDQIEALATLYAVSKAVGGAGNLAKLVTGSGLDLSSLGIPGLGGKKGAAGTAEKTAGESASKGTLPLVPSAALALFAADGILHLPGVNSTSKALAANPKDQPPTVPVLGKLPQSFETPFGMPGPHDPASANNWLTSWAPYERVFTSDLPKAWSISYEAFQVEFAGKITSWFSDSLPHFFTAGIPMGWSTAYEGFQRDFAGPLTSWFSDSLPHFFTSSIPADVWSPAYQGFERDIGSPIAAWFSGSLPHFFDSAGSLAAGWGKDIGSSLESGWNTTEGAVTGAFSKGKTWVTGAFSDAATWLQAPGKAAESGLATAWNATEASARSDFAKAKGWATSAVSDASGWLKTAGKDVESGLSGGWLGSQGSLTADLGKAKGWVTGAFSGAGGWLTAAGTAVMGGFLSSLESEYTSVQNFVSSVAGWIAAHKGPVSEDYQLLQPAGRAIMGGFGDALQAEFAGSVQPFVGSIAGALAGSVHAQSMASLAALGVPSVSAGALLPGVGSPLSGGPLQLQVSYTGSGNEVTDALVSGLQFHIVHATGGDVQAALGQGSVRT